jgi:4-hydroxythreonine-4-phosphate dehydrogenase
VALKAVSKASVRRACLPVMIGDLRYLRHLARSEGLKLNLREWSSRARPAGKAVAVVDVGRMRTKPPRGKPSRSAGRAAGRALEEAVNLALAGRMDGMVTAPVSKESFALAGHGLVGHTELLARLTHTRAYAMMLIGRGLRVVFATTHLPLRGVAAKITIPGLLEKLRLTRHYLDLYLGIRDAKIAVSCLNPHCGESGHLGKEEKEIIRPAIQAARREGIGVEGPFPADSICRPTVAGKFDAILAMYHDQGMIALKLRGHGDVVNITLGIPVLRVSPGHGTAFDLAGKHVASDRSMTKAILECAWIAKRLRHAG